MKTIKYFVLCIGLFSWLHAQGSYVMPPTSSGYGHAPVISDELMKQCVKQYNYALQIEETLNATVVNQYSQYEVDQYNNMVRKHAQIIDWFNINCSGKQSYSACKATQELNKERGLPYSSCNY